MSYRKRCIINDIDDNENNDTLLRICDRLRDSVCEKLPSKKNGSFCDVCPYKTRYRRSGLHERRKSFRHWGKSVPSTHKTLNISAVRATPKENSAWVPTDDLWV